MKNRHIELATGVAMVVALFGALLAPFLLRGPEWLAIVTLVVWVPCALVTLAIFGLGLPLMLVLGLLERLLRRRLAVFRLPVVVRAGQESVARLLPLSETEQ